MVHSDAEYKFSEITKQKPIDLSKIKSGDVVALIGDFNPKMIKIVNNLGTEKYMTLRTYRKLFDEKAVFERCKTI